MFEGDLANGVAAGGQLTTTTDVENYPGFPDGISGPDICETFRQQSLNCGATIHTETVTRLDLQTQPFEVQTKSRLVRAATVIIATGAVARRLDHAGATEFWQRGISACAVCDGAAPIFRNVPLAVIGGGDTVRILMPPSGSAFSSPVFCVNNLGGDAHSGTRYAP
jgi:thioredoxin reductase (NADPH)